MNVIKGKQLSDQTISQKNMSISTSTITSGTSVTNKDYVFQQINEKSSGIHQSILNQNMTANNATIGELACDKSVIEFPISTVLVKVNGIIVNVGIGLDCYFSGDTIRTGGNAQKGDYLYWNSNKYDLTTVDEIDFDYLTASSVMILSGGTTVTLDPVYNSLVVKYTGDSGTTMNVIIDGVTVVVGNVDGSFVWDIGGPDQHIFTYVEEYIVVTINGNAYTIWWDGFGSLIFSVKKEGIDDSFRLELTITSDGQEVTIPQLEGYNYNYIVNWGDGNEYLISSWDDTGCTHTYATAGVYVLKIKGICETFYTDGYGTIENSITKVLGWGNINLLQFRLNGCYSLSYLSENVSGLNNLTDMSWSFYNCTSLTNIPEKLFNESTSLTDLSWCFGGCTSLINIPEKLFNGLTNLQTLAGCFSNTNLTSIPENFFNGLTSLNNLNGCFNFANLTSIPQNLFNGLTNLTDLGGCFYGCSLLTSIPENIFSGLISLNNLSGCFNNCSSLTSIPENIFSGLTSLTDLNGCFNSCASLTSIPNSIFNGLINLQNLSNCFYSCTSLTSIPENIFSGLTSLTDLGWFVSNCGITSIPENLFSGLTSLNSLNYFFNNTPITSIPNNLFIDLINLQYLSGFFDGCTSLTSIPNDIFNGLINLTNLSSCFYGCTSLTSIPENLFNGLTSLNNLSDCFNNCSSLTSIPNNLLNGLNNISSLNYCFSNCTSLIGESPYYWYDFPLVDGTDCFLNDTNLDNYNYIPDTWGGLGLPDLRIIINVNVTSGETITIPHLSGYTHNYKIKYGDNSGEKTVTSYNDSNCTHTYSQDGSFIITISGTCETLYVNNTSDNIKLSIYQIYSYGKTNIKVINFNGCTNLIKIPSDNYTGLTNITNFSYCFNNCTSLTTIPIGLFNNCTGVTDFSYTFNNCTSLTGYVDQLWNSYSSATGTSCFNNDAGLTNYNFIPNSWGGINENKLLQLQITTTSTNQSITIPHSSSYSHNYIVDYGDNSTLKSVTSYNDTDCTHTFSIIGTYTIKISGTCQSIYVNNSTSSGVGRFRTNIKKIISWGNVGLKMVNFYGCVNLNNIVDDSYSGLTNVVNYQNSFRSCSGLTSIPSGVFNNSSAVTNFDYCFYGITGITSIPSNLFKYNTSVTSFTSTFEGCSGLTSIPSDIFQYNTSISILNSTFKNCSSITSIPSNILDTLINLISTGDLFRGTSITSIPTDLFKYNVKIGSSGFGFSGTFASTSITGIPSDLFRYNVSGTTSMFYQTFMNCKSLTTIPIDLFRYNTLLTNGAFSNTFNGCSSLTGITTDLFKYNTLLGNSAFDTTFANCTSLISIPTDLFRYNTEVANYGFNQTFSGCTSLETVPQYLFRYNRKATGSGFYATFLGCTKLQLNQWIFYASGETGTRFSGTTVDFTDCFNRGSFNGTQGTAPDLWNCTGTFTKTRCFAGAGNSSTSLTNYSSIPSVWKT